jgi:hypothetical protein
MSPGGPSGLLGLSFVKRKLKPSTCGFASVVKSMREGERMLRLLSWGYGECRKHVENCGSVSRGLMLKTLKTGITPA